MSSIVKFDYFTKKTSFLKIYKAIEWSKISEDAKDLIKEMLTYDVDLRISATQALNNSWIQKNAPNEPLNSSVLQNLGNFHVFFNFKN